MPSKPTKLQLLEMQASSSWLPVNSSNVRAICWRPEQTSDKKSGLGIWFAPKAKSGKKTQQSVYFYPSADFEVYVAMRSATSKGQFIHQVVVPKYPHIGPYPPGA